MLTDKANYLSTGAHIGMTSCTKYMKNFMYKIREDGLVVFNLQQVDERIKVAADFLSQYERVLVAAHKQSAYLPAKKFAETIEGKSVLSRFSPGTLTNPSYKEFYEPDVILIVDPLVDTQAIKEAKKRRVPIVALCDTFNEAANIDLVIPSNNNGRKSIGMILWLMAREILKSKGKIKKDSDFKPELKEFTG